MPTNKRYSFYNPGNERSFIQTKNDDEAERAIHRKENNLETQLSTLSISNTSKNSTETASNGKVENKNSLPLFQLQDHFQTCLKMYTSNKINTQNAWQLDVFTYMQKLITSDEKTSNILQVAGSSIEVGTKIYCARVDDIHNEVLKLANALNKVHIKENDESFMENETPDSDNENDSESKEKQKTARRKKILKKPTDSDNKVTIYPCDLPLNATVNKSYSLGYENSDKIDFLETDRYQKPRMEFEFFTKGEAKSFKWSQLGSETLSTPTLLNNPLFTDSPPKTKICNKLSNFYCDLWDDNNEFNLNSSGYSTQTSNPIEDDYHYEPNATVISEVETAANAVNQNGLVFITDMRPGNDNASEASLQYEYSFRSLPNISENFKVTGAWVGPARWKLKWVRGNHVDKNPENTVIAKKQIKRTSKCRQFEFVPTSIEEIQNILVRANKRTIKKTTTSKDVCTCSEYMEILEERRITLMTRPNVKVYRSRYESRKSKTDDNLNITSYDYENLNDSEYCPTEPLNNWEENTSNCKPPPGDGGENYYNQERNHSTSFNLIDKSINSDDSPLSYALKAKVMDMKKLKSAVWNEICSPSENSDNNCVENRSAFSTIYKSLPNKLSTHLNENLSPALAFISLLHLANEHNLRLNNNDDNNDVHIYK